MSTISCYLNNLGMINALGSTKKMILANLLENNKSGITPYSELFSGNLTRIGAVNTPLQEIPLSISKYRCRNNQLLATAYEEIRNEVERLKEHYGSNRIGILLGTSTSGIAAGEAAMKQYHETQTFPNSFDYIQQEIGSSSEFLSEYAGIEGISYTISTACSSSGKAFAMADRLIKSNQCDAVIVGGADSLCELTLNGFDSLDLLSPSICNPFSVNRSGLNIGEGAALFILSKEPSEIKLIGTGEASDGYHMTAPDPNGKGAKLAITEALNSAKISAKDIGYINLHGTATKQNDLMEGGVIHELFGDKTLCSSTKPLTGHTLGASGALELGLCWLLLSSEHNPMRVLSPHCWDNQQDPELPLINLIPEQTTWNQPRFMSNSFAFGGSNVCLIIEKE